MFYLDTSAAVKLVVAERGSTALERWLASRDEQVVSSDVLRMELLRAAELSLPSEYWQKGYRNIAVSGPSFEYVDAAEAVELVRRPVELVLAGSMSGIRDPERLDGGRNDSAA
ncbi:MAG: PIN domain-containing protein [Acidimicrobiia bacterium]